METKKVVLPTIIAVVTLIALVAGATYAFFAVGTTDNFGTTTINATAASVGTVAVASTNSLKLAVSAVDMMNNGTSDIYYFAVPTTETSKNYDTPTQATAPVIGTATVTGNGTFNCQYTLEVTPSSTSDGTNMLTKLKAMTSPKPTTGQLILTVNGDDYDLHSTAISDQAPLEIPGTFTNIKDGEGAGKVNGSITAQLKLVNKYTATETYNGYTNSDKIAHSQNDLAGTDLTLTFAIKANSLTCTAVNS